MRTLPLAALSDFSDPELNSLLHPASAFGRPQDVVRDPDLTTEEKRAILLVLGVRCVRDRTAAGREAATGRKAPGRF
jgi:hypothetical protein